MTRLGIGALAVLVLTTLLGAATTIQPPAAAAAEPAVSTAAGTAQVAVETTGQLPARPLKMGCLGPDELCDLGGDALDCAKDPVDRKDAAGGVKDEIEGQVEGVQGVPREPQPHRVHRSRGSGAGVDGCGMLDAICDGGLPGIGLPGCPGVPDPRTGERGGPFGGGIPGVGDIPNPFENIGDVIAKAAADAWTAAMLAVWSSACSCCASCSRSASCS